MRLNNLGRRLCTVSSLALAIAAAPAFAQEANSQASATDAGRSNIDNEIVVTAQKREQRLIDVPVAINTMSGDAIADRGITDLQQFSYAVPGLVLRYDGPGSSQVFLRGAANIRGSDAMVATYMDEVPVTLTGGFRQVDLRMLDIDRIEVLKGPQGTLYGQGAMTGTVRFVTKNPDLTEIHGFARADYSLIDQGSDNLRLSGALSLPVVTDVLAIRVAGNLEDGGGWIDQPGTGIKDGNNQNIRNFRGKILFKPSSDFDLTGTIGLYRMSSRFGLDYENPDRTRPVPVSPDFDLLPSRKDRAWIYNLTANYHFDFATLTSSSSYVRLNRDYYSTYIAGPGTPYTVQNEGFDDIHDRARQFTQELRLTSAGSGPLQYTVGVYYRDARSDLYDTGISYFAGGTYPIAYEDLDTSKSWSGFADLSYRLTQRLTLGAGVRTFSDDVTQWNGGTTTQKANFKSTDPRVYFTYALGPKWNLYGNVSRGFRSGGFNTAGLPPYRPEKLTNYELGTKGVTAGGALQFDIDAFYSKYDDALRTGQFFNFDGGGGFVSLTRNIGDLEIYGLEASATWAVTPNFHLSGMAALTHSEVTKLAIQSGESTNVEVGDPGDYAPEVTFSVAADYDVALASNIAGFAHADFSYRDKTCASDSSVLVPRTQCSDTVPLLNARIGATFSRVKVELYATNLTNENRQVDPYQAWQQSSRTKPRTVGIALSHDF